MSATLSLLTTKLYLPAARPDLVRRSRLLARLSESLTCPLTLISAPAGFGKTTLISEWHASAAGQTFPLACLALDDDDNDPARFLTYVVAALATLKPDFGETILTLLNSPQPSPPKLILTRFINEVNLFTAPFALVLDDYHLIHTQAIHEALTFLLDHLPPLMHIVITTRVDPPLPLARLRARRQLLEIRGDDLRFTTDEAAAFLNQVMGLNLAAADIAMLETRTEGWVAGLQMAALSMQGRSDISHFINTFTGSHRYIIDYLLDEVLQQQPADLQQFLLQTSILHRLCGPLCDAILDHGEANRLLPSALPKFSSTFILEKLERANLFLLPLDNERRWYRYHHLFAEVLQHRLESLYPQQIASLHRRASAWHEQHGLMAEAIYHALSAADFERAAHLVEQVGQELLMRSEMTTLLKWLDALPAEVIGTRPRLCLLHAWTLILNGQIAEAEQRLQEASTLTVEPAILGQAAAIHAFIALFQGDMQRANEMTRQALEFLPTGDPFLRGLTAFTQGIPYYLNGDVEAALQAFAEVEDISQKSGSLIITIMIRCQMAEAYIGLGQLHQALATYQRVLALETTPEGEQLPGAGQAYLGLGTILYEWNDLEKAARHLAKGLHLSRELGEMGAFDGHILQMSLKQAQGDDVGALEAIEQAGQIIEKFSPLMQRLLAAYRIRIWLRQGNLAAAAHEVTSDNLKAADDLEHTYHFYEFKQLTLVRVLIAQAAQQSAAPSGGSSPEKSMLAQEALQVLEALYPEAVKLGRGRSVIEIWLLRALAYQVEENYSQATTALTQALSLAQAEGFVRLFVDEGAPVAELLGRMKDEGGRLKEYIHKLLTVFEKDTPEKFDVKDKEILHPSSLSFHPLVEPLSERELEILRLIAAGQSNEEIAQTLVIAMGTVKKHINNIYGKLGVHSRTQALAQAKTLNLLP